MALITAVVLVVFSSTIFAFPLRGRRLFGYVLRVLGITTVSFSIFSIEKVYHYKDGAENIDVADVLFKVACFTDNRIVIRTFRYDGARVRMSKPSAVFFNRHLNRSRWIVL
ncbi:MAG: hypothetical protein LBD93_05980 [Treponema sp.]|nr:hypothetical protein [Treponema sp.]